MRFKVLRLVVLSIAVLAMFRAGVAQAIPLGVPTVTLTSPTGKGTVTLTTNQPQNCFFVDGGLPVTAPGAGNIQNIQASTRMLLESDLPEQDPVADYPFGLIEFVLICSPSFPVGTGTSNGVAPQMSVDVTMTFSDASDMAKYNFRKYGPTPDNNLPHWYDFGWDGTTGVVSRQGNVATLHYVDGLRGDDIVGFRDFAIFDQVGPTPIQVVPAMNEWGMIVFVAFSGLASLYFLRRRQRVG